MEQAALRSPASPCGRVAFGQPKRAVNAHRFAGANRIAMISISSYSIAPRSHGVKTITPAGLAGWRSDSGSVNAAAPFGR